MAITDLTGTAWVIKTGFLAASGYGIFAINGSVIRYTGAPTRDFTDIRIGYSGENKKQENNIVFKTTNAGFGVCDNSYSDVYITTITGGSDATNTDLIAWLSKNGEMQAKPIIKAGTYRWNNELTSSWLGQQAINFTIPNDTTKYVQINRPYSGQIPLGIQYVKEDGYGTSYVYTDSTKTWDATYGQTFTITEDTEVDDTFGTWFTENTTMLIKAGEYRWNDKVDVSSSMPSQPIKFTCNYPDAGTNYVISCSYIIVDSNNLHYTWKSTTPSMEGVSFPRLTIVYSPSIGWAFGQIVTVTEDQYVPTYFGLWATSNWQPYSEGAKKKFTRLYIGNTVATVGSKCFKRLTKEQTPATAIIKGTWLFNPEMTPPEQNFVVNVTYNCTYSGITAEFTTLGVYSTTAGKRILSANDGGSVGLTVYDFEEKALRNGIKGISFIGEQEVPRWFHDWFTANAEPIADLTDTTWYIPSGWSATAGYGSYNLEGSFTREITSGTSTSTFSSDGTSNFYIGYMYSSGSFEATENYLTGKSSFPAYLRIVSDTTLNVTGGTDVTNADLIAWLGANGELVTGNAKTITAGTYKFKGSGLTVPTWTEQAISFKTEANSYTAMYYRNNMLEYSATDYSSQVYSFGGGWIYDNVSSITIPSDANVTEEFYNWFTANAELVYELSGEWVFKSEVTNPSVLDLYQEINFTSCDGEEFVKMGILVYDDGTEIEYHYADGNYTGRYNSSWSPYWKNDNAKIIDFGDAPQTVSKEFYTWFTANATKQ